MWGLAPLPDEEENEEGTEGLGSSGPDWRLYAALERRFARIPCLLPARGQTPGLPSHGPSQLCPGDGGSLQNQGETTPQA